MKKLKYLEDEYIHRDDRMSISRRQVCDRYVGYYVAILPNWRYTSSDDLKEWCDEHNCEYGFTYLTILDEERFTLFKLRWL